MAPNKVKPVVAIIVNKFEFNALVLLKFVAHLDLCLEIRVQVVVNALGLSSEDPLIILEFKNPANRV